MKWIYKGMYIDEVPENAIGFTYLITHKENGMSYVGCKLFYSTTNRLISKKRANELYSGKGAKKKREKKVCESNWRSYCSSSKNVQELIKDLGEDAFNWEIIGIFDNKTEMLLHETRLILEHWDNPLSLNMWLKVSVYKPKK